MLLLHQCCCADAFANHQVRSSPPLISVTRLHARKEDGSDRPLAPKHVAFICDGNSRWAEARLLPASAGHAAGADRLLNCLETLQDEGVEYCTMYGFSTENWKRSDREIRVILAVIEQTAKAFKHKAIAENIRVKILGNLEDPRLPRSLLEALVSLERETYAAAQDIDGRLTACLAINYGGRQDIMNASLKLAKAIAEGKMHPSDVTEADLEDLLYTADIPDPDLVVRTGGDQRLSNFLLWNVAYSELYFTDVLWPDFDEIELNKALTWFSSRSRRFGGRLKPTIQSQP